MILTCPSCETRYRVDAAALAEPGGRELRCAKCGHQWRYVPGPAAVERAPEPAPPEPPLERPAPALPLVASEPPQALAAPRPIPQPAAARGSRTGIGCLVLIVALAALVATAVLARNTIVAVFPPAARVYGAVGLRPEPPGTGLQIGKVAPTRNGDALVVEGEVTNTTNVSRTVPPLRIALRDAAGKELTSKVIDPPAATLAAGGNEHFRTQFEHPSDAATGVAVTFAGK